MKPSSVQPPAVLWQVGVTTSPAAEAAVAAWLEAWFGQPAWSYTDAETGAATVAVCLPNRPDWSPRQRRQLAAGLARIHAGRLSLKKLGRRNWAQSWKRHFKPLEIGRALLLKPSWSRRQPRPGQAVVVLDPGLSFGTGRHATTAFCLRQLVARRRPPAPQSFLDAGTGSGVLAIAAAKLGYAPIAAFDFDPEAIYVAHANTRKNRVSACIRLFEQDLTKLPRRNPEQYSLVCANLTADLLIAERRALVARMESGASLVLAGILRAEFPHVCRAYAAEGLRLAASRADGDWRSGAFVN